MFVTWNEFLKIANGRKYKKIEKLENNKINIYYIIENDSKEYKIYFI